MLLANVTTRFTTVAVEVHSDPVQCELGLHGLATPARKLRLHDDS
jgi:hypothetical protein